MARRTPPSQPPLWYRERGARRIYRRNAKAWGVKVPALKTVVLVKTEIVAIPAWALAKAVPGLKAEPGSVWLYRIAANALAQLDRAEGGRPQLTPVFYRRCGLCSRGLIGRDAELRWEQDREWEGRKGRHERDPAHRGTYADGGNPTPCGQDCVERQQALKKKRVRGS